MKRSLKNFGGVQTQLSNHKMKNIKGGSLSIDLGFDLGGILNLPAGETGVRIDDSTEIHKDAVGG